MSAGAPDRPAAVYRLYSHAGDLLYIGASVNPDIRERVHSGKPWGQEIDNSRTGVTWYPSALHAAVAERDGIRYERPRYNTRGVRGKAYGGYRGWCKREPRYYEPEHWALESLRELGARRRCGILIDLDEVQAAVEWARRAGVPDPEISDAVWVFVRSGQARGTVRKALGL